MNKTKQVYIKTKDFLVSGESFDLEYDSEFDMLQTKPKPSDSELHKYYESEAYISHTDEKRGFISAIYQIVKKYSLISKINLISKFAGGNKTLLDIGAGTGDFMVTAKSKGFNVTGIEVNKQARKRAAFKGITLLENLDYVADTKFDVITLWHVLEHLPNLNSDLNKVENLLNPNGVLVIAVPNYKSYDAQYYKEFWAAYDVPRHLWHFSRKSINKLISDNFTMIKIKPMIFDSFYVSLLSEKYKTGNKFSFKAPFIGLLSNIYALRTKEYSSLIYMLQKKK